eukprot:5262913-Prymnesium_polylepis.1
MVDHATTSSYPPMNLQSAQHHLDPPTTQGSAWSILSDPGEADQKCVARTSPRSSAALLWSTLRRGTEAVNKKNG